jgi:hypothetical protein
LINHPAKDESVGAQSRRLPSLRIAVVRFVASFAAASGVAAFLLIHDVVLTSRIRVRSWYPSNVVTS